MKIFYSVETKGRKPKLFRHKNPVVASIRAKEYFDSIEAEATIYKTTERESICWKDGSQPGA